MQAVAEVQSEQKFAHCWQVPLLSKYPLEHVKHDEAERHLAHPVAQLVHALS